MLSCSEASMYINPIHAGPVAFAQALISATRKQPGEPGRKELLVDAPRPSPVRPLQRLAQWWRELDNTQGPATDPLQMMMWGDCGGHPHASALSGFLLLVYLRRKRGVTRS